MNTNAPSMAAGTMDKIYRHQRHIYNATRRYYLLGRDQLISDLSPPEHGSVLEIGCGTGRNLLKAAKAYSTTQLYGLDVSAEMLKTAQQSVFRSGYSNRICLGTADATDFDPELLFGICAFDRIFISYCLSMIPNYPAVLRHAVTRLRPGGEIHIVDFGRMHEMPGWVRKPLLLWLDQFEVTPRRDLGDTVRAAAESAKAVPQFQELYLGYVARATISVGV